MEEHEASKIVFGLVVKHGRWFGTRRKYSRSGNIQMVIYYAGVPRIDTSVKQKVKKELIKVRHLYSRLERNVQGSEGAKLRTLPNIYKDRKTAYIC